MQIVEKILKKFNNESKTNTSGTITDGASHEIIDISLFGNTFQQTYTGKNLLDDEYYENGSISASTGEDTVVNTNGRGENYISVKPNTQYTLSTNENCLNLRLSEYSSDKSHIQRIAENKTNKLTITTTATTSYVRWSLNYNANLMTEARIKSLHLQLEEGSTATSYEPYVGGIPAPNPDYPQTIQNVSGEVEVKVANGTDSTATGYQEQTVTLHLPENFELCKIDSYQDSIIKQNGKWYKNKSIGKIVLDGSETGWYDAGGGAPYTLPLTDLKRVNNEVMVMSNYFIGLAYSDNWSSYNSLITTNTATATPSQIKFKYTDITSLANFKTWLSTHNTTVYYVLNEPVLEEITDSTLKTQLDSLLNLSTYDGTTYITVTSLGQIPAISVSYYTRFIKRYIRNLWYLNHLQDIYK